MKKYDVFISYAIEDKFPVAAGIAERLKKSGLNVYFVGDRLKSGDLISDTINDGLEESNYCVMIVSLNYVRHWPAIERNHILNRERKEKRKLVFPVWNNISMAEVKQNFPELIDYYAPPIDLGLDQVADHLQQAIHKRKKEEEEKQKDAEKEKKEGPGRPPSSVGKFLLLLGIVILLIAGLYYALSDDAPRDPPIRNTHPLSPDN